MKPKWNEGLAAFDREVEVLNALSDEYEEFMEAVCNDVVRQVARSSGETVRGEVEEGESFGQWWVEYDLGQGLEVRVWPASPWGGPPAKFRVGVFVDPGVTSEESMPDDVAVVATAVRESLGDLDGVPGSTVTDSDLELSESICIHVATVDIDRGDFIETLATSTLAYCRAAEDAGDAIEALRAGSPYRWLREILAGVLSDEIFKGDGAPEGTWTSKKLMVWNNKTPSLRYIEVAATGIQKMWLVVHGPEGRLAFHLAKGCGQSHAESVCSAGGCIYVTLDGFHGGLILDADAAQEAFDAGDGDGVRAKLMTAWKAHVAQSVA